MGRPGGVHLSGHNKLSLKITFWENGKPAEPNPGTESENFQKKKKRGGGETELNQKGKKETEEIFF